MLKKEEYQKTVKRPYPPIFCSLVCMGYPRKDLYEGVLDKPYSIRDMAHVDNIWYYGKKAILDGGVIAIEYWKNPEIFEKIKKEFNIRENNLINSAKKGFNEFCNAYQEYMPVLALIFAIEKPVTEQLKGALLEKLPPEKVEELMGKLNIPLQDNFHKQEEYDLVNSKDINEHVKKYHWLYARYGDESLYTVEDAKEKLSEINKEEFLSKWREDKEKLKQTILYVKKLLEKKAYLVDIFQYMIFYRTQRTDIMNKAAFLAIPIFKKTAEFKEITYEQLMRCSALEILENKIPLKDILNQRMKDCTTLLDNAVVSCLTGEESQKIIDFFSEDVEDLMEFKGNIACKGSIKGRVKIIYFKNDFNKIKIGDILVTSMTTPEMIPIMKKAASFVTDEGGVTCHAAIISREMNKPCVIGTKIATKVLHDGDLVEVDANNGIVRVIEKAKT
jgi:phosphohistidine swiveling domain-containing protein